MYFEHRYGFKICSPDCQDETFRRKERKPRDKRRRISLRIFESILYLSFDPNKCTLHNATYYFVRALKCHFDSYQQFSVIIRLSTMLTTTPIRLNSTLCYWDNAQPFFFATHVYRSNEN